MGGDVRPIYYPEASRNQVIEENRKVRVAYTAAAIGIYLRIVIGGASEVPSNGKRKYQTSTEAVAGQNDRSRSGLVQLRQAIH